MKSKALITRGTADLVLTHANGSVTVIDHKTGDPSRVDEAEENLQLLAYGVGVAMARKAPGFRVGLHFTQYPPIRLSRWFEEDEYPVLVSRIKKATLRDRETPVVGQHCDKCYRRRHCSAWLLPASLGGTALAPYTSPSGLSKSNAAQALAVLSAMEDACKVASAHLKDFARSTGGITLPDGTVWGPTSVNGRTSVSYERIPEELLPQLERAGAIKRGSRFEQFRKHRPGAKAAKGNAEG